MASFFFPDGKEAWIPDPAIMALLLLLIFAIFFPWPRGGTTARSPGKLQSFLEMLVSGLRGLVDDAIGDGAAHAVPADHRRPRSSSSAAPISSASSSSCSRRPDRSRRRSRSRSSPSSTSTCRASGSTASSGTSSTSWARCLDRAALLRHRDHRHVRPDPVAVPASLHEHLRRAHDDGRLREPRPDRRALADDGARASSRPSCRPTSSPCSRRSTFARHGPRGALTLALCDRFRQLSRRTA